MQFKHGTNIRSVSSEVRHSIDRNVLTNGLPFQSTVRSGTSGGKNALMYSWYFPKDEPSTELGHRHDWEGVIIWLSDATGTDASNIEAVCPSAHGGWDCSTDGFTLDGTSSLIKYESIWPVNHSCGLTTTVGGTQPLVAWESMSSKLTRYIPKVWELEN